MLTPGEYFKPGCQENWLSTSWIQRKVASLIYFHFPAKKRLSPCLVVLIIDQNTLKKNTLKKKSVERNSFLYWILQFKVIAKNLANIKIGWHTTQPPTTIYFNYVSSSNTHQITDSQIDRLRTLSFLCFCMTFYDFLWLCLTMFDYLRLCMAIYDYLGLCRTMYDYVLLYMTMVESEWLCIILYASI